MYLQVWWLSLITEEVSASTFPPFFARGLQFLLSNRIISCTLMIISFWKMKAEELHLQELYLQQHLWLVSLSLSLKTKNSTIRLLSLLMYNFYFLLNRQSWCLCPYNIFPGNHVQSSIIFRGCSGSPWEGNKCWQLSCWRCSWGWSSSPNCIV